MLDFSAKMRYNFRVKKDLIHRGRGCPSSLIIEGGIIIVDKVLVSDRDLVPKGKEIYAGIKDGLEKEHKGEIVAINVDTGDYFLGRSAIEAGDKGRQKYPEAVFYFARVGYRAVYKFYR